MALSRLQRSISSCVTVGALAAAAAFVGGESSAHASGPVSPTGKGIVGGALLGAEVVDMTMGIIGVERGWPYFVFGGLGAVGGGIGGYFVEQNAPTEASLYMLAGGMALVIPTLVLSLNATKYKPPESDQQTEPLQNQPTAEPQQPAGPPPAGGKTEVKIQSDARPAKPSATPYAVAPGAAPRAGAFRTSRPYIDRTPHVPMSVVDVYQGKLALALPAPDVRPLFTQREIAMYGLHQGTQFRLPVLQAQF